jgi:tetratricopeptide (TPR) repeat protein
MSKPMLVTFPFALLLLDYWPLRRWPQAGGSRFAPASPGRLFVEKLPLFILTGAAAAVAFAIKRELDEVVDITLTARVANAVTSYGWYLWKTFLPIHHGLYYSHPREEWAAVPAFLSTAVLAAITLWAFLGAKTRPWFLVGWLWFLGTLIPVIGLVQVGDQARADRFVYLPHIGLFIAVVWGVATLGEHFQWKPAWMSSCACVVVLTLAILTWLQVRHWSDAVTIWEHTYKVTGGDGRSVMNLGTLLSKQDNVRELERGYAVLREYLDRKGQSAFRMKREVAGAHFLAGLIQSKLGHVSEAIRHYEASLELGSDHLDARNNLGHMLLLQGRVDDAIEQLTRALRISPDAWDVHMNLGASLMQKGEFERAAEHFTRASASNPTHASPPMQLGIATLKRGMPKKAEDHLRRALDLDPERAVAQYFLGLSLMRQGRWVEAVPPLRKAAPHDWRFRCALAYALHQSGDSAAGQEEYDRVSLSHPEWRSELSARAFKLATDTDGNQRETREALELAVQTYQATGFRDPRLLDVLAVAQAAMGDFAAAKKTAADALALSDGIPELKQQLAERLRLYQQNRPVSPGNPERP